VTRNNGTGLRFRNCNERILNLSIESNWRASLVPAAAVIPAPIAYIKVVAVKKLVVEFLSVNGWLNIQLGSCRHPSKSPATESLRAFTLRKLERSKQAIALNTTAWNNIIGLFTYLLV
jgi:hypothetical protein